MMAFIRRRLRKPVGYALAGTVFAAAWAVRGGPSWFLSIVIEVGVLAIAITTYQRRSAAEALGRYVSPAETGALLSRTVAELQCGPAR